MRNSFLILFILFFSLSSIATASQEKNLLLDGKFIEIREFSPLNFDEKTLKKDSKEYFEALLGTINSYVENNATLEIKVLGHSNARIDIYDKVIAGENEYKKALKNTVIFAQKIVQRLVDSGLSYESINIDYKNTKTLGFIPTNTKEKNLSNHVVVTMYVISPKENKHIMTSLNLKKDKILVIDTDKDGILDEMDIELQTPRNYIVDSNGRSVGIILTIGYNKNSAQLPENVNKVILELVEYLNENIGLKVHLVGYTSRTDISDMVYNIRLSLKRAKVFKEELKKYGINENRLTTDGRGFSMPIADNKTLDGRMKNRRIEIEFKRKVKSKEL